MLCNGHVYLHVSAIHMYGLIIQNVTKCFCKKSIKIHFWKELHQFYTSVHVEVGIVHTHDWQQVHVQLPVILSRYWTELCISRLCMNMSCMWMIVCVYVRMIWDACWPMHQLCWPSRYCFMTICPCVCVSLSVHTEVKSCSSELM